VVVSGGIWKRHNKIVNNKEDIIEYETYHTEEDMDVLVVAYGFTARSSLYAVRKLREEGKKVGMLRFKTIWPFPDEIVKKLGAKAKKIFIPEMNMGQISREVKRVNQTKARVDTYNRIDGQLITPEEIYGLLIKM